MNKVCWGILLNLIAFLSLSCKTYYKDELLADGDTWRIYVFSDCVQKVVDYEKADYNNYLQKINSVKNDYTQCEKLVSERATTLCGKKAERIFGCLTSDNKNQWMCYAKCTKKQVIAH